METKLRQVVAKAAVQPQIPVFPSEVPSAVIPGGHQCLWSCFLAVLQSGIVQQLPYHWGCINLSLWLPVFSRILQNIPAAIGFKGSLMTSRWLGMSRLLPTPWAGDAQKWDCKCLFSLVSPHRNNCCSPLQMLWDNWRIL